MPIREIEDSAVFSNPLDDDGAESAEESDISAPLTDVLEDSTLNDVGEEAVQEFGVSTADTDVWEDRAPNDAGAQSVAEDTAPTGT